MDYAKAFDSVAHKRLLIKLRAYGLHGKLLNWIESFLRGRFQKVSIRGHTSQPASVTSGVPQGSVLGPLLFILYVNEIPDLVTSQFYMYADDSKLMNDTENSHTIQQDLDILSAWSKKWLLRFNEQKCKTIHFGYNNPETDYVLNDIVLEDSGSEVDLGVTVTRDCKPSEQCAKVAKKAMQRLGLLRRTFKHIDKESFKVIYPTYVRPIMETAVQSWSPYYEKDIDCLERVQKYATSLVPELREYDYERRLQELNLFSMKVRRLRGDLIEMYKFMTNKYSIDHSRFFKLSDKSTSHVKTRGNSMKVYKPQLKKGLLLRKNFFSIRTVNNWNELPEGVVNATSVSSFKHRLDHHQSSLTKNGTQEALPKS